MFSIWKEFSIEAAHFLPNTPENHKCRRLHGHSFKIEIHVERATLEDQRGWVVDFADVTAAFMDNVHALIDHRCLNDVPGLENPTSEVLARWAYERLTGHIPVFCVVVRETCTSGCSYKP